MRTPKACTRPGVQMVCAQAMAEVAGRLVRGVLQEIQFIMGPVTLIASPLRRSAIAASLLRSWSPKPNLDQLIGKLAASHAVMPLITILCIASRSIPDSHSSLYAPPSNEP